MNGPKQENICAVIVTYHPDKGLGSRIDKIREQVGRIVIVDNNSSGDKLEMIRKIAVEKGCSTVFNSENLGIAAAFNQGLEFALKGGFCWALLFDQDSLVEAQMVECLREVYDSFSEKDKIAVIGSNYIDEHTGRLLLDSGNSCRFIERKTVISSGSLISMEAFKIIGPMREDFFIDHVDDEYCLRAIDKGYRVLMTKRPVMRHSLGSSTMHRFLWKVTGTSNHSVLRRYYMTRNHILLAREYLLKEPSWVLDTFYSRFKSLILMCLFEEKRLKKLWAIVKGTVDGLLNKTGKRFV